MKSNTKPFLKAPITKKTIKKQSNNQFESLSIEMQGWRRSMEDHTICQKKLKDGSLLFAVFDGHSGPQVSEYLSLNFDSYLQNCASFKKENYGEALRETFIQIDKFLYSENGENELEILNKKNKNCLTSFVKSIFTKIPKIGNTVGSTANVVLITKTKIFTANAGDSRSILVSKNKIIPLSQDHNANNKDERQRIQKSGQNVSNGRINGELNVSRGFGDFRFKNMNLPVFDRTVTCVPEIVERKRTKEDRFILMGCDGLWNIQQKRKFCKSMSMESMQTLDSSNSLKKYRLGSDIQKRLNNLKSAEKVLTQILDENIGKEKGEKNKIFDNMTAILIEFK